MPLQVYIEAEPGPVEYTDADGRVYRRDGACNGCGQCCKEEGLYCSYFVWAMPPTQAEPVGKGQCAGRTSDCYVSSCKNELWLCDPAHIADKLQCGYQFTQTAGPLW